MNDERIETRAGVCLVGGGHVCPEVLAKALKFAPELIAADGGADAAIALGHRPRAVIGDFDSISERALEQFAPEQRLLVTEQDTTDFEKCLSRIEAPFVVAVGFTGRRIDHTLAVLSVMVRYVGRPVVLVDEQDVIFAAHGPAELDLEAGTRVSLFPMASVTGRSSGLRWSIEGLSFAPNARVGTSNYATGPVYLEFDAPDMLVILPADALEPVIAMLRG